MSNVCSYAEFVVVDFFEDNRLSLSFVVHLSARYCVHDLTCSRVFAASSALKMAEDFDLDFGKKNSYVPAQIGDGGQGQFGAQSPSNWRVPGTSPVGQVSYPGASDGGDEPWFSEAVSTVFLDLGKAEDTLKAFTKEAAEFKAAEFATATGVSGADAVDELVESIGYSKFLELNGKQLKKEWDKLKGKKE